MAKRHVYGPVPSRRLGRSLGVDVIPFKTCTYDCTYCQLGHTTCHTIERREYVDPDEVLEEIAAKLKEDTPDIISFAGSGEPTLNSGLGRIIHGIRGMTDVPVAVFTNSSLLWMPEVRAELMEASMVSPSLDAADVASAEAVNTLARGLNIQVILEGLRAFCAEYKGQIWIEILLCKGINDSDEELDKLKAVLEGLPRFDRIQLNTATRPPADRTVLPLTEEELDRAGRRLGFPYEIIASFKKKGQAQNRDEETGEEDVLDLVRCHPSTVKSTSDGLNISEARALELLEALHAKGSLGKEDRGGEHFYILRVKEQA